MPHELQALIGQADCFMAAIERVSQLAELAKPALIIGERGTGKELIAARLHYLSSRWEAPFVKLNCAAVSEELLESELFGHVTGAFTGASKGRLGRFEMADGGSLFLDELASMSTRLQEKLLRVIEYGEFERLGSSETLRVEVRLIGAANVDLPEMAAQGKFRSDLLDRLSFDVITLPPMRERREDVAALAQKFGEDMAKELRHELFPGFTPRALAALEDYGWPGNVRELKNVVERAVYRHGGRAQPITRIQFDPFDSPYRPRAAGASAARQPSDPAPAYPFEFKSWVEQHEIKVLNKALRDHQFNQRRAAKALRLSYDQLRGYIRKYDLTAANE